jgi:hypothetical protein
MSPGPSWRSWVEGAVAGRRQREANIGSPFCSAEMADKLKELSARTDIPQARLLRQALELLFVKYEDVLKEPKAPKGRR